MARPTPAVELRYDGAWQPITLDTRTGDTIKISRGRRNWAAVADPAELSLTLNQGVSNISGVIGRYAANNPRSDLYGLIGRNTPVRVRTQTATDAAADMPGAATAVVASPDSANLSITGDMRLEMMIKPRSTRPVGGMALARDWEGTDDQRSWAWYLLETGHLRFRRTTDGTLATDIITTASVTLPDSDDWIAFSVDVDVNNGAGGNTVIFQTAPSLSGPWVTLGAAQTNSGTAATFNGANPIEVGRTTFPSSPGIGAPGFTGRIGGFTMRAAGVLKASPDFTTMDPEDTSITDAQGNVWTIAGGARIGDPTIRFSGEAAAWPTTWDLSGKARSSAFSGAGILRRLQRRKAPLKSSLTRDLSTKSNVVAYYPLEEPRGATAFASGLAGDNTRLRSTGAVTLAAYDALLASSPLPTLALGSIRGALPAYAPDASQRLIFFATVPVAGVPADTLILDVSTTGTAARWTITLTPAGSLKLTAYSSSGAVVVAGVALGFALNGVQAMISLWLDQTTVSNVFHQMAVFREGSATISEGNVAATYGRFRGATLGSVEATLNGTAVGHLAIMNGDVHSIWDTIANSLQGWAGEDGGARLVRLGTDEGIPVQLYGAESKAMGPQRPLPLMELMREVPAADLAFFADATDTAAIAYRPHVDMIDPTPALVLDYTDKQLAEPFQPTQDDQATVNSVEATAVTGETFTAIDTTSRMSVLQPPAGVGLYDQSVDVNVDDPFQVPHNAGWRLALGTQEEERYPTVRLNLNHPNVEPIAGDILAVRLGDIIRIQNLPEGQPPGPVDLIVDAIADEITPAMHVVEFTCAVGTAWAQTDTYGPATGTHTARYDTAGTVRNSTATSTQTAITMQTTAGPLWTTDAADFPFDIMMGGERMTVTAIGATTGSGNQLFTVVRSVNGVVKSHPAGTTAALADPTRYAY